MHNNAQMQRENIQITQPCSAPSSSPSSPLASPGALSTSFCMPSSGNTCSIINTGDPNWQATKSTVRERNAAMFNNELMADISFVVGSDGKLFSLFNNKLLIDTNKSDAFCCELMYSFTILI